jgi:hypothetical protein
MGKAFAPPPLGDVRACRVRGGLGDFVAATALIPQGPLRGKKSPAQTKLHPARRGHAPPARPGDARPETPHAPARPGDARPENATLPARPTKTRPYATSWSINHAA